MSNYDLVIIGGGPAGYIAAERAGARGKSVLLLEERAIGGSCLNEGCIPTKTLLHGAKLYAHARDSARFGVTVTGAAYDLSTAMDYKDSVIRTLQKGILSQMKRHGVEVRTARGTLRRPGVVEVDDTEITAAHVLLAQGSDSARPPIPGAQESPAVLTSREILQLRTVPQHLVVIGGGYIGMEFASFFSTIGTRVTVVEMMPEIIPMLEPATAQGLRRHLSEIDYRLGHRVDRINGTQVHITDTVGSAGSTILEADCILLATGRVARLQDAGVEAAGIATHRGGITTDQYQQTNLPGVYAAGDITGRMLLAHAAYRMGEVAVAHMFRQDAPSAAPSSGGSTGSAAASTRTAWPNRMRYHAIPWVVFTMPEVAGCGLSPREAQEKGVDVESSTVPLQVSGRYLAENPGERGTVTITVDRRDQRLIGVQMMGSGVGEIIHSAAAMIEMELRVADIREIVFPHPTVSEAVRDAAWALPF